MTERGNDNAVPDVRPHAWAGAALLAAGALALLVLPTLAAPALLAGATLVLATTLYWYLPSFAKRAVVGPAWLAALPVVLLAAGVAAVPFGASGALQAAGLVALASHLLASALLGPLWRSGIPFWRTGAHEAGDRAAAIVVAMGLALLAAAPILRPLAVWPAGILVVALGCLAHFLPRSRGRAPLASLIVAGAAVACAATLARSFAPAVPAWAAPAALLAAAAGTYAGPATKRAGPRLREARFPLAATIACLALAAAGIPHALSAAAGAAALAVCVLALPVVFNQRPAAAFLPWASALAVLASPAALLPWPTGPVAGAAAVALALASLAPLRRPRRWCPPDPPEPS